MRRAVIDLTLIVVVYLIYWGLIVLATSDPSDNLLTMLGITASAAANASADPNGTQFREDFTDWAMGIMFVSGIAVLIWYVLGEWGPRAQRTSGGTWVIIWLVLFVVVLAAGLIAVFVGPQASENELALASVFLTSGVLFFWLATVFLSPVTIKHLVFPAKYVRFW